MILHHIMSRLLVAGLCVAIAVLGFSYYTEINRGALLRRELDRVRVELRDGSSARSEALKRLELCGNDLDSARAASSKLQQEAKQKVAVIKDLSKQINESRKELTTALQKVNETYKMRDKAEKLKRSLNTQLTDAANEAKV